MAKKLWTDLSVVPSTAVPPILTEDGTYAPGGFACKLCEFTTTRRAMSGRQALRAHLKIHRRDTRAWKRPLAVQLGLITVAATVAVSMRVAEPEVLDPVVLVVQPVYASVALAAIGVILLTGLVASARPRIQPTTRRLWLIRAGLAVSLIALGAAAVQTAGTLAVEPAFVWVSGAWITAAVGLWLSPAAGLMRRALRRRKYVPGDYIEIHRPRDDEATDELMMMLEEREWRRKHRAEEEARAGRRRERPQRQPGRAQGPRRGTVR